MKLTESDSGFSSEKFPVASLKNNTLCYSTVKTVCLMLRSRVLNFYNLHQILYRNMFYNICNIYFFYICLTLCYF